MAQLRMKEAQLNSNAASSPGSSALLARIAQLESSEGHLKEQVGVMHDRLASTHALTHESTSTPGRTSSEDADHHVRRLQSLLYQREKVPTCWCIVHRLHRLAVPFTREFPRTPDWRQRDAQDLRRSSQRIEMLQEQVQEFAQGMSPLTPSF